MSDVSDLERAAWSVFLSTFARELNEQGNLMAHTGSDWGGRRAAAWSAAVLEAYGRLCWLRLPGCTTDATTADHVLSRRERPDLAYVLENGRPACSACNSKRRDLPLELLHTIGGRSPLPIDGAEFFER